MASLPSRDIVTELIGRLRVDFPQFSLVAGNTFCWSPSNRQITYKRHISGNVGTFSLLHEIGHGVLEHKRYRLDLELVLMEAAAWEEAKKIAARYNILIDEDHIQDCLDSYRDWLYRRSVCPDCSSKALQADDGLSYRCFNCYTVWRVAPSRFCRPYRQTKNRSQPSKAASAVFSVENRQ